MTVCVCVFVSYWREKAKDEKRRKKSSGVDAEFVNSQEGSKERSRRADLHQLKLGIYASYCRTTGQIDTLLVEITFFQRKGLLIKVKAE